MVTQTITYDGSDTEMMRLGLVDEMGVINSNCRNEYNQYMARVWAKKHPTPALNNTVRSDSLETYFAKHERLRAMRRMRIQACLSKIFG